MNKQELFEKALNEFDEWPYDKVGMACCIKGVGVYVKGEFISRSYSDDTNLNTINFKFVCSREEFEAAKAKCKPKPIYTKEMQERGEFPAVGMEVEVYTDQHKNQTMRGEAVHIGQSFGRQRFVVQCENWIGIFCIDRIKPIDTRTAKEKAINEVIEKVGSYSGTSKKSLSIAYDKWVGDENEE
jgi:hypothetical protein